MTPADRQTLAKKLEYLRKQLDRLEPYCSLGKEELFGSLEKRLAVERLLEICLQSVIDCSRLLVVVEDWRKLRDKRDPLLLLAERGVINQTLAEKLVDAKGFRNILVHEYAEIDPNLFLEHLQEDVPDLWAFAEACATYLKRP